MFYSYFSNPQQVDLNLGSFVMTTNEVPHKDKTILQKLTPNLLYCPTFSKYALMSCYFSNASSHPNISHCLKFKTLKNGEQDKHTSSF